jgi:hypothetical protein
MRNRIFVSIVLVVAVFSFSWSIENPDIAKVDERIDLAMSHFFGQATPGADSKKGFIYLVDAIEMAAPHTDFGDDFTGKITEANALFKSTSIFNEEGVALLHEGYREINSGKDFEMPKEISSIEDARQHARKQIVSAKKYLKANDFNSSVKLLMEVAVMIVTPMTKDY